MSCDNVKTLEKRIYPTKVKQDVTECIDSIISRTWYLKNPRREINLARIFLQPVIKHVLSDRTLDNFARRNAKFFYDIMINDIAKWTVKKEVLKVFYNCLINEKESCSINSSLYDNNSSDKFYIYKLIDLLSIYGDYDFQALIIEVIFRTTTLQQLKDMVHYLIPELEGENLRQTFSKINMECLNESTRDFLNCLNQNHAHIFSVNCSNVTLGNLNCQQYMDKSKGTWIDFNMIDIAISWYTVKKPIKAGNSDKIQDNGNGPKILITMFKSDVEKIQFHRFEKSITLEINLNKPCLCSHEECQPVIDKAMTVSFQFNSSEETNELVTNIIPNMFQTKLKSNAKMEEKLQISKPLIKTNKRKCARVLRKQTLSSINEDDIDGFSDDSSCYSDCGHIATQSRKKLKSCHVEKNDQQNSEIENTSHHLVNKSVLRDKDVNIPSRHKSNNLKKASVICIKSELDLFKPSCVEESDIDNMSVCFTSEEQLISMANDFDVVRSFLSKQFSSAKHSTERTSHMNNAIYPKRDSSKQTRNVKITRIYTNSLHSSNGEKSMCSKDANSTLKLINMLEDSDASLKNFAKKEAVNDSDVVKLSSKRDVLLPEISIAERVKHVAEEHSKIKKIERSAHEKKSRSKTTKTVPASNFKSKKITKKNHNFTFNLSQSLTELLNKTTCRDFKNGKSLMDLTIREAMEDVDSVKSSLHNLDLPETPTTPPPAIFENNQELFDSPFSLLKKKKPVKPIPVTPLSQIDQPQNNEDILNMLPRTSPTIFEDRFEHFAPCSKKKNVTRTPKTPNSDTSQQQVIKNNVPDSVSLSSLEDLEIQKKTKSVPDLQHLQTDEKHKGEDGRKEEQLSVGLDVIDAQTLSSVSKKNSVEISLNPSTEKHKCPLKSEYRNKKYQDIVSARRDELETSKSDSITSTVSYSWSVEALFSMHPAPLCSKDFYGHYLLIVFFHFDIFTCEPTFISEMDKIDKRIKDFIKIKSRVLFCGKKISSTNLEVHSHHTRKFDSLQIPLIVDTEGLMSSMFKVCSNNCSGTKSILLLDDKGNRISNQYFIMERELDIDSLLLLITHSQKYG